MGGLPVQLSPCTALTSTWQKPPVGTRPGSPARPPCALGPPWPCSRAQTRTTPVRVTHNSVARARLSPPACPIW
eukprot:1188594-Prorocentrum_minimum.AAC.2